MGSSIHSWLDLRGTDPAAGVCDVLYTEGGALFACGANSEGQLGMGVAAKKTKYTAMTPLTCNSAKFVKVAAGALSSAAVTGKCQCCDNDGCLGRSFSPWESLCDGEFVLYYFK